MYKSYYEKRIVCNLFQVLMVSCKVRNQYRSTHTNLTENQIEIVF